MHSGDRLHDASVADAQAVTIDGLHSPDVGAAELRQRNAGIAVDRAGHAGCPQQLVIQVPVHELMNVAQILQEFPRFAEWRRDQFDQGFGEIGRDVLVGQRRSQRLGMACVDDFAVDRHAQGFLLDALAPAAQYRPLAGIKQAREATLEDLIHHVTQHLSSIHDLRKLGDDFDLHEKAGVDQPLHLHPRSGRQSLLVVILEA